MMIVRLTEDAREAVLAHAFEEAARSGDERVGTEHILLGLLHGPESEAAGILGVGLEAARDARSELDRAALRAIGIEGPDIDAPVAVRIARRRPLTSGAADVFRRAVEASRASRTGRIGVRHFLVAILSLTPPDPAAEILSALKVDADAIRARLADRPGGAR